MVRRPKGERSMAPGQLTEAQKRAREWAVAFEQLRRRYQRLP